MKFDKIFLKRQVQNSATEQHNEWHVEYRGIKP